MNIEDFKVACCVVTYNQEHYISQALDSILVQQTDFPVDIIVGNDCSTDNTAAILTNYAAQYDNIVVLNATENGGIVRNTVNVFRYIFEHEEYKYVAMLDGDDWWCDNQKLQLQVEYMEKHPDYSMVYTRGGTYSQSANRFHHSQNGDRPHGNLFSTLIRNYPLVPNSAIMHRVKYLKNINWDELLSVGLLYFDYPVNVMMAAQGGVGYIDRETCIWRRGIPSVSAPDSLEKINTHVESRYRQGVFLKNKFPNTPYDMPMYAFEQYRQQLFYEEGMAHKNWILVHKAVSNEAFPAVILKENKTEFWVRNHLLFNIYIYKKLLTLIKIVKRKLN